MRLFVTACIMHNFLVERKGSSVCEEKNKEKNGTYLIVDKIVRKQCPEWNRFLNQVSTFDKKYLN